MSDINELHEYENRSKKKNKNKLETDVPNSKLKSVSRALKNV